MLPNTTMPGWQDQVVSVRLQDLQLKEVDALKQCHNLEEAMLGGNMLLLEHLPVWPRLKQLDLQVLSSFTFLFHLCAELHRGHLSCP